MPKKAVSKSTTNKAKKPISMTQLDIGREIVRKLRGYTLKEVLEILDIEKQVIRIAIKRKKRVVLRNFLTFETAVMPERKWKSALDGKTRTSPSKLRILVRPGKGFKDYVNSTKN
ncbi:HU family DNA-binding protein [Mycoplasmatota bacterium WC44]